MIAIDLLTWFFLYKMSPDNYGSYRLWEFEKVKWKFFYGSNYHPYHRAKLVREVQRQEYRVLFDDKGVCEQLCRHLGFLTPQTWGIILPDENYRQKLRQWLELSSSNGLIIKPLYGRAGIGVVLLKKVNNRVMVQSEDSLIDLNSYTLITKAIVQDILLQHKEMARFSTSSVNTIRIITMITNTSSVLVLGAYLRIGIGDSYVDHVCRGGLGVAICCDSGRLYNYALDKFGNRYFKHPTLQINFHDVKIPAWDRILDFAHRMHKVFSFYKLFGMDIALNSSGEPVIIEINASPDMTGMEVMCGSLLSSDLVLRAFGQYDLLVNRYQRSLYDRLIADD